MRLLLLVAFLASALPASAQFTPPGESESFFRYGVHFDVLQGYPGDRWTLLGYDDAGATVYHIETLTPLIIYGLVDAALLGGDSFDSDGDNRSGAFDPESSNTGVAPGFISVYGGKTFLTTPFGEFGAGVDAGFTILGIEPENAFVAHAGPNLLYTARPIPNLHVLGHLAYHFLALSDEMESGRIVFDVEGYYPLNSWIAVYGGLHWSTWDATNTITDMVDSYTSRGLSIGLSLVPTWQTGWN